MKKKLEAELISIAHRILKLKNKAEIEQLQQETLKLYEKLSVLRFVEENFNDVKPTIGFSSAEEKLEDIYGVAETKEQEVPEAVVEEEAPADAGEPKEELGETEQEAVAEEAVEEKAEEPVSVPELEKPEEEIKAMEESVEAVYENEQESSDEEEIQATDAETITIEPDATVEVEESEIDIEFAFERKAAPEEPKEEPKKEVTIDDFRDYKDPEFVKKSDFDAAPVQEEVKDEVKEEPKEEPKQEEPQFDYSNQPVFEPVKNEPVEEVKKEEPKKEEPIWTPAASTGSRSLNDKFSKTITLGLNDRIAFEKHLFGGSADDLNRVVSQLNTINTFGEAKSFINDLIKPDYNNWDGKEEYEERFFQLVEKRFD
ncbi:hypothetical protein GN157_16955 [Flavobacterium rakeshii]|uniref:Uncharacterized protein n=1 Tax=Flavobacterium rakeshii TaxID=1038845 RepID=A0A6N8HI38_9FLAO|nr:hypothetical protein [Flavobacterium rakeshii]MUV05405.1 hypothetical protein [Flavobacterium rakeshii]